jgi:hypothetical protein
LTSSLPGSMLELAWSLWPLSLSLTAFLPSMYVDPAGTPEGRRQPCEEAT